MWDALERGGRMNIFDLNMDPTLQRTFWTCIVGLSFGKIEISCCTQASGQRFLSCKSVKEARIASGVSACITVIITVTAVLTGCAAYAYYENCDPLKYGRITKKDQLVAVLISDVFSDIPGMTGLFVSAAFSGTLSTISSGINALSALVLEDFVIPWKPRLNDKKKVVIGKVTALITGCLVAIMAFATQCFGGTVVSILFTIYGCFFGPILAVFTLGIFFPWTNVVGVFTGQLAASLFMIWMGVSSVIYGKPADKLRQLPTTTQGCPVNAMNYTTIDPYFNATGLEQFALWNDSTTDTMTINDQDQKPALFYSLWSLSFLYYDLMGFFLTMVISLLVSFVTGANKPSDADPRYFMPFIDNPIFPEKVRRFFRFGVPEEFKFSDSSRMEGNRELTSQEENYPLAERSISFYD
ncbi:unnamed protein product [Clavelina lepadiformis]|uniref:Sodium-dependent multivitamin transporter n=1 Tax=Clavelina lepadiformis TaxID=159417 RepID=A0ABP0GSW8_CLALP